ncbi:adenosine receptor A3 isoform X1 [Hydra vulgaris]|uniref:adenosine receptor A3 isoform X1 n=1 Tax=Hydra vulgaris TaxID=6087 RepID=UPI001F5F8696|nr:adenosine receptor A3-like [Hydra vulgaris]
MICWRTKLFPLPNLTIFAILLSILVVAAVGLNFVVVIIILRMKKRELCSYILLSLSISDLLIGMVLGPITIAQILDYKLLLNCTAHFIRSYILVLLVGSSLLTLAAVSYDRYLLLTKLSNYNQYMTKKKVILLIGFAWFFPGLIPLTKIFNMTLYVVLRIANCTLPLITLGAFYYLITQEVRKREIHTSQNRINSCALDNDIFTVNKHTANIGRSTDLSVKYYSHDKLRKHKRVAKSVTLLIACYLAFIFPLNIWMILELINIEYSPKAHEVFYMCVVFFMHANSCINPIIYYAKQSEIKKGFKQIFKLSIPVYNNPKKIGINSNV